MTTIGKNSCRQFFSVRIFAVATLALLCGSISAQAQTVSAQVAARFLEQASWGPTPATISQVQASGLQTYLQQQFAVPASTYPATTNFASIQQQFFVNALQGQDQLRQRVSFALSQIFVVSDVGPNIKSPAAFPLWMNMLQNDAFGNFFTLMNDVTISPVMGSYLSMAENNGCSRNCRPNENYGRELLQLFTIGLFQLNPDGTPVLDQYGNLIPTYGQTTIEGFGDLFTGWTYNNPAYNPPHFFAPPVYVGPMIPVQVHYSQASKTLLNGYTLAPKGNIQTDLTSGLQNIFTHPNVAPFICKQLIQKLVTSNPSTTYVSNCSSAFLNDGTGVAGNMQAVISEILLDPEARRGDNPANVEPGDGHLREPLLYINYALRALNATSDGNGLSNYGNVFLQAPFLSPSVFNFYPPNYPIQGTSLVGPEFAILNANTAVSRVNFVNDLVYGSVGPATTINIAPYVTAAGNGVPALLTLINTNMMHGAMPTDMYNELLSTLQNSAFTTPTSVAQAALYLVTSSAQFQFED